MRTTAKAAMLFLAALAALGAHAAAAGRDAPDKSPAGGAPGEKPALLILAFKSEFDSGDVGNRVGYSLRAKLRRSGLFAIPDELDVEEMEGFSQARPAPGDVAAAKAAAVRFGARIVVWGEVRKNGDFGVSLEAVDLAGAAEPVKLEKRASDMRQLAISCGELADELARALVGEGYRETYPSFSTDGYARVGDNLVKNGDFEKGAASPDNWEPVDGLCSFRESDSVHGRFVRFDTDVYVSEWQEWQEKFKSGAPASAAPKKTVTVGHKYNTVAGTYGVHLYSDPIAVKPGATYSIELDARGRMAEPIFFAKVFVKGYGEGGVSEELYRMYKAVRVAGPDEWEHFSRIFHPTGRTPGVKLMKVMLFTYWPPGEYAFDNVEIYEVKPEQKAPAPETSLE